MDPCKPLPEQLLRQSSSAPVCKDSFRTLLENNLPKGDRKEIDSEFKKTLVLAYQKPKLLKNKPFRKTKKPLTAKEKRSLGLYRLPRKGLKYSSFVSLHSLWSGYMTELLDLQALEDGGWTPNLNEETRQLQLQMRVCRADLTGALVTVATAACPSHVGATGLVVMETKNTLQIISLDDKLRLIPKSGSSFSFQVGGYKFTVPGSSILSKPAERITKKLKNKYPCKDMVASPEHRQGVLPPGFLREREVEPVGRWFLSQWDRLHSTRTISQGYASASSDEDADDGDDEGIFEDDLEFLRSLDPKETKDQDHYRVLGISKLRTEATDDQIKKAHRFKVLKHHPDKRRAAGEETKDDDDYFSCITKAFEVLGNPVKRKAFDSVDPTFNDDIPDVLKKDSRDFYSVFGPVFESNSRWSNKTPVPQLGADDSCRQDVDRFYSFWYDFDSWREFSYLDEEDKEKAGDKWERREIDKINKAQRKEKKADETKRIRKLVDNAYNSDPRIIRFREEEKNEKLAKKKAKADQAKARKDEEERIRKEQEEKERKEREALEEIERVKKEKEKKEKEESKKLIKGERKKLRNIAKEQNYFTSDETEKVTNMAEVEKICEVYTYDQIKALVADLESNPAGAKKTFFDAINEFNEKLEEERMEAAQMTNKMSEGGKSKFNSEWNTEELQLLIKSVNLFPAGTVNRWEVCAEFINQHSNCQKSAKEVLAKAKEMQSGNFAMSSLKEEVNKMAYENLQKGQKKEVLDRGVKEQEASQRLDTPAAMMGVNNSPWSPDEQKLLEQALKTFPASTPERWDRIAEAVPNRSKKDCMKRYKELAEVIKAKKAAMAAAAKKS